MTEVESPLSATMSLASVLAPQADGYDGFPLHVLINGVSRFLQPTGICRHTVNLANCLVTRPQISRVTLVIGRWQQDYHRRYLDLDPRVNVLLMEGENSSRSRNLWFTFRLPRLAQQVAADIVHLAFPVPLVARYEAAVVCSLHDLYPYDFPANNTALVRYYKKAVLRQCLARTDGVGAISQATLRSLLKHFPRLQCRNVHIVPNYPVLAAKDSRPAFAHGFQRFLLCVAQHERNKQLDLTLAAFAELVPRDGATALSLVVVGSQASQTQLLLAQAEKLGISSRVYWSPALTDAELQWLYRHCDALLSTSAVEGFCLPLAEAMAVGAKMVCTDIPAHREVGGDWPEYVAANASPEQLASAIDRLLSGAHTKSPSLQYSADTTARAALALYAQAIRSRRCSAICIRKRT